jgi:hypothetical protein
VFDCILPIYLVQTVYIYSHCTISVHIHHITCSIYLLSVLTSSEPIRKLLQVGQTLKYTHVCIYNINTFAAIVDLSRFNNSCLRSAMTTMNKKPTRCTIVLKSLKLYCILIPIYMFRALLRPSSGAS